MKWNVIANRLKTVIEFKSQTELANFVLKVAEISDKLNHHADMEVKNCSELILTIYSHDSKSLTDRDFVLQQELTSLL